MGTRYTKDELMEIFFEALRMFNEELDTDITEKTVVLDFFTSENGLIVYKNFCDKNFPDKYEIQHEAEGYFDEIAAEAFVGEKKYGVLIRSDIDVSLGNLLFIFLHELSHLFCVKNEFDGKDFFFEYCADDSIDNSSMNAGYAIWREAIADIMADSIASEYSNFSLSTVKNEIEQYYNVVSGDNKESKKAMSLIVGCIVLSSEVSGTDKWANAEKAIKTKLEIKDDMLFEILEIVFKKLQKPPFWTITPDFIEQLGTSYICLVAGKVLKKLAMLGEVDV